MDFMQKNVCHLHVLIFPFIVEIMFCCVFMKLCLKLGLTTVKVFI